MIERNNSGGSQYKMKEDENKTNRTIIPFYKWSEERNE